MRKILVSILFLVLAGPSRGAALQNRAGAARGSGDKSTPVDGDLKLEGQCRENLSRIYRLIRISVHGTGNTIFPSAIEEMRGLTGKPAPFWCPAEEHSAVSDVNFEIVNNPLTPPLKGLSPDRIAIVVEREVHRDGKRFVLFYDGSISDLDTTEFARLKQDLFLAK